MQFTKTLTKGDVLSLTLVTLIGLIHLPFPLTANQSVFILGAEKMNQGGILYRDFWDLKPPGIFLFYLLGGKLFGFDEIGIHSFELVYMLAFSLFLIITLHGYFEHRFVVSLIPLLTVGYYYAISSSTHLTQVEVLVGVPTYLCIWFSIRSCEQRRTWNLFVSGIMGGIVLLFKQVFLPLLVAIWAIMILDVARRKKEVFLKLVVGSTLPIFAGVLIPTALATGYFVWHHQGGLFWWTLVEYPYRIFFAKKSLWLGRFTEGLQFFVDKFAVLMALGIWGMVGSPRTRHRPMTRSLCVWWVAGLAGIFLQTLSWWDFHYLLLFVPLGILAGKGLDTLWGQMNPPVRSLDTRTGIVLRSLGLVLLFSPAMLSLANKTERLARADFALSIDQQVRFRRKYSPDYKEALDEVAFLKEPGALPGDIYVFGDPLWIYLSGRGQAIALNGLTAFVPGYLPRQWTQILEQLGTTRPPYIFVEKEPQDWVRKGSPEVMAFIERNYVVFRQSKMGVWYQLAKGYHP